jgi:hypothetical protein
MRGLFRHALAVGGMAVVLAAAAAGAVPATAGAAPKLGPMLAFTPSPLGYGPVTVGQTAPQTFTLANSGGSASGALTVTLPGSAEFTLTADTCTGTSLGGGKSCTVTVQFAPSSPGAAAATLTAASSKSATATDSLTGTGEAPGHLYWTDEGAGAVIRAYLDGSNAQEIESQQTAPAAVAVDSSHLYWTGLSVDAGTVIEANLDGSNPHVIASGQGDPNGIAVDSSDLYWTDEDAGTVIEANLDGSNPQVIASGQSGPDGVAVGP